MESNRQGYPVMRPVSRRRQSGITVIGFLILAAIFGAIGLAVLKIVPLYLEKMRITRVLDDVRTEMTAGTNSIQSIRLALNARFYVENLTIPANEILIAREGEGYTVRVVREARAPFVADLSFVVDIDQQVEIGR